MNDILCHIAGRQLRFARHELLCVVGPTASQKTDLAIQLCEQLDAEIISADSVQIYRGFDIGSGKPTQQQLAKAVHHLIGTQDPFSPMDAAEFSLRASELIDNIRSRNRIPIVCGGTFLWVKSLIFGLAQAPRANRDVRTKLNNLMRQFGTQAMHDRLAQVDPCAASRLHPHDWVRVQRALEVYELTGKPLSELHQLHRLQPPKHQPVFIGTQFSQQQLDERIRKRADQWLKNGWIEEVSHLLTLGMQNTRPMNSVGYRQVKMHLQGELAAQDLLDAIVRATRVFARRQRTWLRDQPVRWMNP